MRTQAVQEHLQDTSFFSPVVLAGSSLQRASGSVPHPKLRGCCASERSWTPALPGRSQIKAIRLCRSVCPAPAPRTGLTPSCESEACEAMKPTLLLCPAVVHRTNPPWDLCQCTALGTAILFSLLPSATVVTEKAASSRARGFLTGVLASRVLSITSATIEAEELI